MKQGIILGAVCALFFSSQSIGGFKATHPYVVEPVRGVAQGKTWTQYTVQPWKGRESTVWGHCERMLGSYGAETTIGAVKKCVADVAKANNKSVAKLSSLTINSSILLPLLKKEALRHKQAIAAREAEAKKKQAAAERRKRAALEKKTALPKNTIQPARTVKVHPATFSKPPPENAYRAAGLVAKEKLGGIPFWLNLWSKAKSFEVPAYYGLLLFILVILPFWIFSRKANRKIQGLEERVRTSNMPEFGVPLTCKLPKEKTDFCIVPVRVDKRGTWYRTAFTGEKGDPVLEENLPSHFSKNMKVVLKNRKGKKIRITEVKEPCAV